MNVPKFKSEAEHKEFWDGWHADRDCVWADLKEMGNNHPTLQEYFARGEERSQAYIAQWNELHPAEEEQTAVPAEEEQTTTLPQETAIEVEIEPISVVVEQPALRKPRKPRKPRQPKPEQLDLFADIAPDPQPTTAEKILRGVVTVAAVIDTVAKVATTVACAFILLLVGSRP